jgi:predicted ATP-grasp superfamily ATP-dependent carboligase/peptidoglycan/xylan/chitin deacetylase (PgdA/CDA1 family)
MARPVLLENLPNLTDAKHAPAVIANMSYSGLGLARALGRHGVPVIALSPQRDAIGMNSRYVTPMICPAAGKQEDAFLEFLECLGRRLGRRSVFFPTGDNTVLFLATHGEDLRDKYEFVVPEASLIRKVVRKDTIFRLCIKHGIATPNTIYPRNKEEMVDAVKQIGTPCIIKPVLSPLWWKRDVAEIVNGGKVFRLETLDEAKRIYEKLAPLTDEFIVQEIIPGEDKNLFYFVFYVDREGNPLVSFAGQKLRVTPAHYGSASYVKSIHDPNLEKTGLKLVEAIGYIGLGGIEFKLDPRDGSYKLIEFNARFGLWDILATRCGIDLPWIAYRDALGLPVEKIQDYKTGVIWLSLARDLSAFRQYRSEGSLSLFQWLRSLTGKKYRATFAWDDPRPGISEAATFLRGKAAKLMRAVTTKVSSKLPFKGIFDSFRLVLRALRKHRYVLNKSSLALFKAQFKRAAKYTFFFIIYYLGITRVMISIISMLHRNKYSLVLIYHHVFRDLGDLFSTGVGEEVFEKQVQSLKRYFEVISLDELILGLNKVRKNRRIPVAITFDDGFEDNYSVALPVLERHNIPATLFLATENINSGKTIWTEELRTLLSDNTTPACISMPTPPHSELSLKDEKERYRALITLSQKFKALPEVERKEAFDRVKRELSRVSETTTAPGNAMMSWEMVRSWLEQGMTLGSHGKTHAIATRIKPDEFRKEIDDSKKEIESQAGAPCVLYAYPNGEPVDFNGKTKELLIDTKHKAAVTCVPGFLKKGDDAFELKRKSMGNLPLFVTMNELLSDLIKESAKDSDARSNSHQTWKDLSN